MQGRKAKHIKLAKYVQSTCNVQKSDRWWVVFRHECVYCVDERANPLSTTTSQKEKKPVGSSYIPVKVIKNLLNYCFCGNVKKLETDIKCTIYVVVM